MMDLSNNGRPRDVATPWTFDYHDVLYKPIGDTGHPILLPRFDLYLDCMKVAYEEYFPDMHWRHRFYCQYVFRFKGEAQLLDQPSRI